MSDYSNLVGQPLPSVNRVMVDCSGVADRTQVILTHANTHRCLYDISCLTP
jgi:hypothetical protein